MNLTRVFRQSVLGYFQAEDDRVKLLHFNKLVDICTTNTTKLFIPTRTKGIGLKGGKVVGDHPIKDLAEEFVAQLLFDWQGKDIPKAVDSGQFDYVRNRFKQRVLNKIRDVRRSREEEWVEMLPEEPQEDPYDGYE